jgi:hypothetical protein
MAALPIAGLRSMSYSGRPVTGSMPTERLFAANAALRAAITPGGRGPGSSKHAVAPAESPIPKDIRMNWARRLKRILAHRRDRGEEAAPTAALGARAPPQASLF